MRLSPPSPVDLAAASWSNNYNFGTVTVTQNVTLTVNLILTLTLTGLNPISHYPMINNKNNNKKQVPFREKLTVALTLTLIPLP